MSASDTNLETGPAVGEDQSEQLAAADSRADAKAIVVMLVALILFAVHFASGWTFDV